MIYLTRRRVLAGGGALGATALVLSKQGLTKTLQYGLVVYGATPSGIMAAYAGAREGLRVALIVGPNSFGGMSAQGLSVSDVGNPVVIGGLARNFFERVGRHYGLSIVYNFEPHVAFGEFAGYVHEAGIDLIEEGVLTGVVKTGAVIDSIRLGSGAVFNARFFIDASYEGDLMAMAGASYRVGRESKQEYDEISAGFDAHPAVSRGLPNGIDGRLLPNLEPYPHQARYSADRAVQAYCFRLCVTNDPANRVQFTKPPGYDPLRYEFFRRSVSSEAIFEPGALPNQKFDMNSDFPGASWAYPDGDATTRAAIWHNHYKYEAGLVYFSATDPGMPVRYRESIADYGLAADEFVDSGNWPRQLYIREGRRLVGQYIMRQQDAQGTVTKPDAIGMGSYNFDCHPTQILVHPDDIIDSEGSMGKGAAPQTLPYQIPYRALLPHPIRVSNLLVTVCVSASHVAFCSLRLEPQYMIMGEAAGVAAGLAVSHNAPLTAITSEVQSKLRSYGAVLSL